PVILRRAALGLFFILKKFSKSGWVLKAESGIVSFVDSFNDGINSMKSNLRLKKKISVLFIILSLLIWLNEAARIYLILLALPGIDAPSFGAVLIASSVATVFGAVLPIGAMHATLISSIFTALGVDIASATTAGILVIMTTIWLSIPLGIIAMFVVGMKMDRISGEVESKEDDKEDEKLKSLHGNDYENTK
ncbi:MAG: flippase-like domain-containing protein, partial [Thermoplasmata archaeon]